MNEPKSPGLMGIRPVPRPAGPRPPPRPTPPPDIPLAGDVVAAIAERIGAARLAAWWEQQTGRPCGCEGRKVALNRATGRLLRWFSRPR